MTAKEFYSTRLNQLTAQQSKLLRKKNNFAWLRLANILLLIAAIYFTWPMGWAYVAVSVVVLLILFAQIIYRDLANRAAIAHNQQLININQNELKALAHEYFQFENGSEFSPKEHLYANDLDVFGHASLFQFCNRTVSEMGAAQLAQWLLRPATAGEILQRQEAVKELAEKHTWHQNLQALGKQVPVTLRTQQRLEGWLQEPALFSSFVHWRWLRFLLPAISITITLAFFVGLLPQQIFYLNLFIMAMVALPQEKKVNEIHNRLSKMVDELETLSKSIEAIEKEEFASPLLKTMQEQYKQQQYSASQKIKELKKILDRLDVRFNIVLVFPLNLLLLWNLQQMLQLEKWKKKNDADVSQWFDTLGTFEALISFAVIHFNQPDWVFPVLKDEYFSIEATNLG
ncbi:MAG: hypothetical protein EOO03_03310, partial [Chitinophagaceae bacterium]